MPVHLLLLPNKHLIGMLGGLQVAMVVSDVSQALTTASMSTWMSKAQ